MNWHCDIVKQSDIFNLFNTENLNLLIVLVADDIAIGLTVSRLPISFSMGLAVFSSVEKITCWILCTEL